MAYFPNGTAGMMYEEKFCYRCKNYRDKGDGRGFGCGIWDAHLLYCHQANLETGGEPANGYKPDSCARHILDFLIPHDEEGFPAECSMFWEMPRGDRRPRCRVQSAGAGTSREGDARHTPTKHWTGRDAKHAGMGHRTGIDSRLTSH